MLYDLTPHKDEKYSHQTKLSSVTDEEYAENTVPWVATWKDRLIQLFFFIVFFGWLRFLLLLMITIVYVIIMLPVILFCNNPKICKYTVGPGIVVTRIYFRFLFFFLGCFVIKRKGKLDPNARCIIYNHNTLIDGLLIYMLQPFRVIVLDQEKSTPIIGQILTACGSIFVGRSKHEGFSKVITNYLSEKRDMPLAIAPEGRTNKGFFMLSFRTGAFIADAPIQPVTLRYKNLLPFGRTGIIWTYAQPLEWLIRVFCMPACIVEMDFLPVVQGAEFYSKTPAEKALYCNLLMANHLQTKASDRSTRVYLRDNSKKEQHQNPLTQQDQSN